MGKHIVYKNHCTPQEQRIIGGRYYLDSDANRKLTGSHSFELGSSSVGTGTLTSSGFVFFIINNLLLLRNTLPLFEQRPLCPVSYI